jgi:hypothetical protein
MRPGRCSCSAEETPDGAVVVASWGEPHAGHLREHYRLVAVAGEPDELHVTSAIHVGQRSETTLQVGGSPPDRQPFICLTGPSVC